MVFSLLGKGSFSLVNTQSTYFINFIILIVFEMIFCILEKRKYLSLADCITRQHSSLPLPPLHIRGQNIGNQKLFTLLAPFIYLHYIF